MCTRFLTCMARGCILGDQIKTCEFLFNIALRFHAVTPCPRGKLVCPVTNPEVYTYVIIQGKHIRRLLSLGRRNKCIRKYIYMPTSRPYTARFPSTRDLTYRDKKRDGKVLES